MASSSSDSRSLAAPHDCTAEPKSVGVRLSLSSAAKAKGPYFDRLLASAAEDRTLVFVMCPGRFPNFVGVIAHRFPAVQFVVDYLGMRQPPTEALDPAPLRTLPSRSDWRSRRTGPEGVGHALAVA